MKLHARSTSRRWTVWHSKGPLGVAEAAFTHEMHRTDHSDYGIELEYDPVHCVEGTVGCELVAELEVRPHDYRIFGKRRYDAFLGTDLDLLLRAKRIENLICCGVTTHVCVMSTVFTARNLDYRVLLPRDAVAAVSAAHQQAALLCMSDVFAYITTCAEVMALWPGAEVATLLSAE